MCPGLTVLWKISCSINACFAPLSNLKKDTIVSGIKQTSYKKARVYGNKENILSSGLNVFRSFVTKNLLAGAWAN